MICIAGLTFDEINMEKELKIPDATIERVALYLRPLENLLKEGAQVVSSEQLADLCNVNPAQVRKDLSFFGEFGVRGVGYDVIDLQNQIITHLNVRLFILQIFIDDNLPIVILR